MWEATKLTAKTEMYVLGWWNTQQTLIGWEGPAVERSNPSYYRSTENRARVQHAYKAALKESDSVHKAHALTNGALMHFNSTFLLHIIDHKSHYGQIASVLSGVALTALSVWPKVSNRIIRTKPAGGTEAVRNEMGVPISLFTQREGKGQVYLYSVFYRSSVPSSNCKLVKTWMSFNFLTVNTSEHLSIHTPDVLFSNMWKTI